MVWVWCGGHTQHSPVIALCGRAQVLQVAVVNPLGGGVAEAAWLAHPPVTHIGASALLLLTLPSLLLLLLLLQESLRQYGQSGLRELSDVGGRLAELGSHTGKPCWPGMHTPRCCCPHPPPPFPPCLPPPAVADLEAAVQRAVAAALDARWPVRRWPVYVFTAGAMVCMLTSAVCHLFGCCAAHIRWARAAGRQGGRQAGRGGCFPPWRPAAPPPRPRWQASRAGLKGRPAAALQQQ